MAFAFYFAAVGFLAFLPNTYAYTCGDNYCFPDDDQEPYCCGVDDEICCYNTTTNVPVATLWWFWVLFIFVILFSSVCCTTLCCRRHRRRSRLGYVVVRGETHAPTVIQTHSHASQVVTTPHGYPQPCGGGYPPQPYNGQGYPVHQGYQTTAPAADDGYPAPKYQQQPPKYQQQPPPNYQQQPPNYDQPPPVSQGKW